MREADYIINDLSCSLLHEIPADESYELLVFVCRLFLFTLLSFLFFCLLLKNLFIFTSINQFTEGSDRSVLPFFFLDR